MMGFEEVEHTADKALRIFGANLTEFFLSAAAGLTHLMAADVSDISTEIEKTIELDAIDAESLLVEWLSELAYWAESEMLARSNRQPPHICRQKYSAGKHPCLKNISRR
jgi:SHS2 domain-containing protein